MKIPKHKPVENSRILLEQAEELAGRILTAAEEEALGTEENPQRRASRALRSDFIKPITRGLKIRPGQPASSAPLNKLFTSTKEDLEVLSRVSGIMGQAMVTDYNVMTTKESDLIGELKTLRDKISALKLYATDLTDDDQYIAYTFSDGTKVEQAGATYNEAEGAMTLPEGGSEEIPVDKIEIIEGSNGRAGNQADRTRPTHGNVNTILDGHHATWFEYERLSDRREGDVKLVLKITFKEPSILNRITVTPANLGTTNWVKIEDIQIQTDTRFVSIAADVASPSWSESDNPFELSPASSKFAGTGSYTFEPRMARAVQLTFVQNEPYPILDGRRLRYAIALRDITLEKVSFDEEGEFTLFTSKFPAPVRAIGLVHNLSPGDPKDALVEYSISTDRGGTWIDMVGLENKDAAKTEALFLERPTDVVQVRAKLKRLSEGFTGDRGERKDSVEVLSNLIATPSFTTLHPLDQKPISFVEVIQAGIGGAGDVSPPMFLGTGSGSVGVPTTFELPIKFEKEDISTLVDGEEWPLVNSFTDEEHKAVIYDDSGRFAQIIFGDGIPPDQDGMGGAIPTGTAQVYLKVDPLKKAVFERVDGALEAELQYPSDKIKDLTEVYYRDLHLQIGESRTGPGSSYIQLPDRHSSITLVSLATSENDYFALGSEVAFQNGIIEFEGLAAGFYWSIDPDAQKIHVSPSVPANGGDLVSTYTYVDKVLIPQKEWEYSKTENKIIIRSEAFTPKTGRKVIENAIVSRTLEVLPTGFALGDYTLVKGSVKGVDLNGITGISRTLESEVDFIDGATEFVSVRAQGGSLLGTFSVDYEKRTIYLPPQDGIGAADQGFLPGKIDFEYVGSEIHHGLGLLLKSGVDYLPRNSVVEFTPKFVTQAAEVVKRTRTGKQLHIRYDGNPATSIEGAALEPHYSPVLRDLAVVGVGIDSRLGTLESL